MSAKYIIEYLIAGLRRPLIRAPDPSYPPNTNLWCEISGKPNGKVN